MKCYKCGKPAQLKVPSLNKPICDNCFTRLVEKKFSKRVNELGIKQAIIELARPSDEVLKHLLERKGVTVTIGEPTIQQYTLTDLVLSVLKSFNQNQNLIPIKPSPLDDLSESMLVDYARIKGLEFGGNPRTGEEKRLLELLKELEERRSGVMYSIKAFAQNLE